MKKNKLNLLNEGYDKGDLFIKGKGSIVYTQKKKYIDLSCGAGTLLLGHNSKVYKNSLSRFLKSGLSQFSHPNISANLFSKNLKHFFPYFEKFILCNTGAEANTKAIRIARAVSKKNLIISVTGSWHGSIDQFLFNIQKNYKWMELNNSKIIKPLSEGVDKSLAKNLKYIPYNNIELSKKILDKFKSKICCIFVEPIQGGFPTSTALHYLNFLDQYCKGNKIILIFDEILSGIRIGGTSLQNKYGFSPALSTFGKILGGGTPIGVIGVDKKISREINKKNIFFGGTYSGNSLSTFIGNETLKYIKKNRIKIFSRIEKKSNLFEKKINEFVIKNKIDAKVIRFYSIIRIIFTNKKVTNRHQRDFLEKDKYKKRIKFIKYLNKNKIYFPANGIIFFNYSLTSSQNNYLINKFCIGLKKYFKKK